jgi:hypothetical protein
VASPALTWFQCPGPGPGCASANGAQVPYGPLPVPVAVPDSLAGPGESPPILTGSSTPPGWQAPGRGTVGRLGGLEDPSPSRGPVARHVDHWQAAASIECGPGATRIQVGGGLLGTYY